MLPDWSLILFTFLRQHKSSQLIFVERFSDRQCGPRILTFFFYLSDVEAGGGTDFPSLNITVQPKVGRAVLWPSVYDAEPFNKDKRTIHQALPVEAGTKFGANGKFLSGLSYVSHNSVVGIVRYHTIHLSLASAVRLTRGVVPRSFQVGSISLTSFLLNKGDVAK